jgi:hypothetical protein
VIFVALIFTNIDTVNLLVNLYVESEPRKKAAGVNHGDLRHIVVAHTGQSSQLFAVTTGRNAQFLATSCEKYLVSQQVDRLSIQDLQSPPMSHAINR